MWFMWPAMLGSLVLIPAFVAVYRVNARRRRQRAALYGNLGPIGAPATRRLGARSYIPATLFMSALTVLLVAAARPQAIISLPRLEGTIMLVFDVSGSMAAGDIQPTRMEAAKSAARDFVARMPSTVDIGVVSFSEAGFATQAPTGDQAAVRASIERLSIQRGTSLAVGIEAALNALFAPKGTAPLTLSDREAPVPVPTPTPVPPGTYSSAVIVLLSDGENTQSPDPLLAAQLAADRGVRIHTVGIGSAAGSLLEIDGFTVRSRLDETTLRQISQLTGGSYYHAASGADLRAIYDNLAPELVLRSEATELTSLFTGAGVLLLLLGAGLSMVWLNRLP